MTRPARFPTADLCRAVSAMRKAGTPAEPRLADGEMIEIVARAIWNTSQDHVVGDGGTYALKMRLSWDEARRAAENAIAAYNPDVRLSREVEELKHDVERQMTIANAQCNEVVRLREALEEAEFLCARLRSLESDLADDDAGRNFYGHVVPSLARMEGHLSALSPLSQGED